jgi:hypothetical protein
MRGDWRVLGLLCAVACGGKSARSGATHDGVPNDGGTANAPALTSGTAGIGDDSAGANTAAHAGSDHGGGGRAGLGGSAAVAGAGGSEHAGAANAAGSAGAAAPCTPGSVRCETVRERCDGSGAWVKESFVCATDITGSIEQGVVCAVKSDGRMTCFGQSWDMNPVALVSHAPPNKWSKLILSDDIGVTTDHDLCGIDVTGRGECWGLQKSRGGVGKGPLVQIAPGSNGLCVIGTDGALDCPDKDQLFGPIAAESGPFQDLLLRNGYLFGLTRSGSVIVPFQEFALPSGIYSQISASSHELCGLRPDHELFCAPNALPPELAAQRFLQVSVGYWGEMCAIREDHSVVCDGLGQTMNSTNPPGDFARFVVLTNTLCGIRTDGSIACFGPNAPAPQADW